MLDFGNQGFTSSPYLDQQVQDALGDTTRAYNLSAQPAFNSAMVNSGSFGNSGVQQMNQEGQRQLQTSLGRQANDMRSNNLWQGLGFDNQNFWANQNFDRGVYNDAFSQGQQQYQNGLGLMQMMNGSNQQSLGMGQQIQNTPMDYYNNFNQQANSIGQGYGTTNSSMTAQSSPLMGALAGAQLYNAYNRGGGSGSAPGAMMGSANTSSWGAGWGNAMGQSGVGGGNQIYG